MKSIIFSVNPRRKYYSWIVLSFQRRLWNWLNDVNIFVSNQSYNYLTFELKELATKERQEYRFLWNFDTFIKDLIEDNLWFGQRY